VSQEMVFLRSTGAPRWAQWRRCFGDELWTSWTARPAIAFSDGPFFSGPLYYCGSVQSFGGPYFRAPVCSLPEWLSTYIGQRSSGGVAARGASAIGRAAGPLPKVSRGNAAPILHI